MSETISIQELRIEEIEPSSTWIIVGPPGSGKSTFEENIVYYNRDKYPVGKFFVGTESGYARWSLLAHPLYVYNEYDEIEEKRYIKRQRRAKLSQMENPRGVNILDDITSDSKLLKTDTFKNLFKLGSQHWNNLLLLGLQ